MIKNKLTTKYMALILVTCFLQSLASPIFGEDAPAPAASDATPPAGATASTPEVAPAAPSNNSAASTPPTSPTQDTTTPPPAAPTSPDILPMNAEPAANKKPFNPKQPPSKLPLGRGLPTPPRSLPNPPAGQKMGGGGLPGKTNFQPPMLVKQKAEPGGDSNAPAKGQDSVPEGVELVNIDFPEPTDIQHLIKAVSLWTGKNVILDKGVSGAGKVQIISPRPVTKEEAYQAFLSALSTLSLTTVDTGSHIKIVQASKAVKGNLKTYEGTDWAPKTDEVICQFVKLYKTDAKTMAAMLGKIINQSSITVWEPTNTLLISDTGNTVRRALDLIKKLDVPKDQPVLEFVVIKNSDPKTVKDRVDEILKASGGGTGGGTKGVKLSIDERLNSLVLFGPPEIVSDLIKLAKKFDVAADDEQGTQASIHVRPLDYADAAKLATTLSSLSSTNKAGTAGKSKLPIKKSGTEGEVSAADLGEGLKITADAASNSLLITGNLSAYNSINSLIRKLDVRRSQVYVEAVILDIGEENKFEFKTSVFGGRGSATGSKTIVGWEAGDMGPLVVAGSTAGQQSAASTTTATNVANTFKENLTVGILAGQSVTVPGLGSFTPGALIEMIKIDSNTKVLSSTNILTSNNEQASISAGERVYFKTATVSSTTSAAVSQLTKEDIDLNLTIKPNISHSNYVTMNITLESNELKGRSVEADGAPIISKRKSTQIVTVKNGQTVVISGLIKASETEIFKKIPLLGDIPILGWLFRNTARESKKSNLAIFLTPHVVHGASDLAAIYQNKIRERDEMMQKLYGNDYKYDEFNKDLPKAENGVYRPTPIDEAEDKLREEERSSALKALGYDQTTSSSAAAAASADKNEGNSTAPLAQVDTPSSETTPTPGPTVSEGGEAQPPPPAPAAAPEESTN